MLDWALFYRLLWLYGFVVVFAVLDQATKHFALWFIFSPPRVIEVLPFLNLVPVWNSGVSFGFLSQSGEIVRIGLTVLAFGVGIILPYACRDWGRLARYGGLLMAGGAFGNGIDRVFYGRVIDFIDIHWGFYHWPAFNLADIGITCGAVLMLCSSFFDFRNSK